MTLVRLGNLEEVREQQPYRVRMGSNGLRPGHSGLTTGDSCTGD